jgi:hypothetical protein
LSPTGRAEKLTNYLVGNVFALSHHLLHCQCFVSISSGKCKLGALPYLIENLLCGNVSASNIQRERSA